MPLAFRQWHLYRFDFMVELRGVEPLSESALTRPSPGAGQIQDSRPVQALPRLHGLVES